MSECRGFGHACNVDLRDGRTWCDHCWRAIRDARDKAQSLASVLEHGDMGSDARMARLISRRLDVLLVGES